MQPPFRVMGQRGFRRNSARKWRFVTKVFYTAPSGRGKRLRLTGRRGSTWQAPGNSALVSLHPFAWTRKSRSIGHPKKRVHAPTKRRSWETRLETIGKVMVGELVGDVVEEFAMTPVRAARIRRQEGRLVPTAVPPCSALRVRRCLSCRLRGPCGPSLSHMPRTIRTRLRWRFLSRQRTTPPRSASFGFSCHRLDCGLFYAMVGMVLLYWTTPRAHFVNSS